MTHSLPYDVNASILFTELPVLQRPAAVKQAGFDAVEFWWPFAQSVPRDSEVDLFVRSVADAGVKLVGLNFAAGDMPAGERGLVSWPARAQEFVDSVDIAVAIAEQLGCRSLNALYGNRVAGVEGEEQDDVAVANLVLAARAVEKLGGTVLVEPISGSDAYPLRTAADALAVIDRVHAEASVDNLAVLADLYHMAVNGDDVGAVIATHASRIGHVQIADAPGRHEPGSGDLPLEHQLHALEQAGYSGWVGLEYKPQTTTLASLDWLPRERRSRRWAGGTRTAGLTERTI
ncbi:hydroxypyruvate isomerase [Micromonospora globispora]|nr:TIM barrel protein [Micromonospora globispora]PWU55412.1 hydroxypyruvate isomerase [Micromonospora globispora]RQW91811.1 hydroxypyruvate isomerase [Micromonospora globispora]